MQPGAVRVLRPAPGPAGARARECGKIAAATSPALPGTVRASPRRSRTPRTPLERRREMEAAIPLGPVPREERPRAKEPYAALLGRLSRQSVVKHFDAYADVDWEREEHRIDPEDPRWELGDDALAATSWYRALPPGTRARLGLHLIATKMKIGAQFENVLQRGLLEFALRLPNGAPEFRYAYHEVIEEGQHSLMFQEFVTRTGFDAPGLGFWDRLGTRRVLVAARRFPALFFIFVLGGEDPIDHVQRTELVCGRPLHPLLERIMRIHVTEEARHLSFARHYLKRTVPQLSLWHRTRLAIGAPVILGSMARLMLEPSKDLVERYQIPSEVIAEAYTDNPEYHREAIASLGKVRKLCPELGLVR